MANRAEKIEKLKAELQEDITKYLDEIGSHNRTFTLDRQGASLIRSTFRSFANDTQYKWNGTKMDPNNATNIADHLTKLIDLLDSQAENNRRGISYGGRRLRRKTHRRRSHKRKTHRLRRSHRA